jgi:hypothetical protein
LDRSAAQIGAPAAWQAGYTGAGVKVAVLDTGVDATHPDLLGRELTEKNFTEDPDNKDMVGHGTHVAATIASAGAKYRGVAPDARVLDGKVCMTYGCAESWILNGMQWAASEGADVINMSLGGGDTPEVDPLEEAVNTLSAQYGTLFVIAAGNSYSPETIGSPGSADAALTVGAVDRNEQIAPFSSRGPRIGDGAVKPDVTAPGVDIVAARSSTGSIGTPVGDNHVALSGTSMATPHVAGAAALLKQQHPGWTGAQIKAALVASAKPNPALTAYDQGAGRVDVARAIAQTVTADPVSVGLGLHEWPHSDDKPVVKEVTYRNSGATAVTLDVALDAKGPDGKPAAAGVLSVSPAKMTVPAGGSSVVTVTGDTRVGTLDGGYAGAVVASSGDTVVRTPVGVVREVESYSVTLDYTDADGKPASRYSTFLAGLDSSRVYFPYEVDGSVTLRLPKGEYYASNYVSTGERRAVLPYPKLSVTGDTTLAIDARLAKPITLSVPDPGAEAVIGDISVSRMYEHGGFVSMTAFFGGFGTTASVAHLGPALPAAELTAQIGTQWKGTPVGTTPVSYRFAAAMSGRAPTGFSKALTARDLATVKTTFGPSPAGREHFHGFSPVNPQGGGGFSWLAPVVAPGSAIDYIAGDGVKWSSSYYQGTPGATEANQQSMPTEYRAGRSYSTTLNFGVFGPTLNPYGYTLGRFGNNLYVNVPLFGDGRGSPGYSKVDTARTALYRDGVLVGSLPSAGSAGFPVPAAAGAYRVEASATRSVVSSLSTSVSGVWTFRSAATAEQQKLPLTVLRFEPRLDSNNSAPAGRLLLVPVAVQQNPGADNGTVRKITVEVSFDDGGTWRRVPVVGDSALVFNPAVGFASLRASATDSKGNSTAVTVLRAYAIS